MAEQLILWNRFGRLTRSDLEALARGTAAIGGHRALPHWLAERGGAVSVAHVHGERHSLWWEFPLAASLRWQADFCGLPPEVARERIDHLSQALGLKGVLRREVASLTHPARALADLAVALLPHPDVLLWEEPFYLLGQADANRAVRLVREMVAGGMCLVAVAAQAPGLFDLRAAPSRSARGLRRLA